MKPGLNCFSILIIALFGSSFSMSDKESIPKSEAYPAHALITKEDQSWHTEKLTKILGIEPLEMIAHVDSKSFSVSSDTISEDYKSSKKRYAWEIALASLFLAGVLCFNILRSTLSAPQRSSQ